jgi:16S rRNA (cytidine1402-2'-O)-methyltransferase
MRMKNAGTLYIVSTPIGNLSDITLRALEVFKSVDTIACEDTRVTGRLLEHFGVKKPLVSYFQHSKLSKIDYLISELKSGKNIALVTDAGTPGISDPGQQLVAQIRNSNIEIQNKFQFSKDQNKLNCHPELDSGSSNYCIDSGSRATVRNDKEGSIKIVPIPGASALIAAASVSGMIEKEFYFAGFLPKKKGRQTKFKELLSLKVPVVIYESANRLEKTLEDFKTYFGEDSEVFIAREITKMFEEYWGGKIQEVLPALSEHQMKGEIVLIVKSK